LKNDLKRERKKKEKKKAKTQRMKEGKGRKKGKDSIPFFPIIIPTSVNKRK